MVFNKKKVMSSVVAVLLLFVCHSVGYSEPISKPLNYYAIFKPFGNGIRKKYELPAVVDPEKHFQIRVNFELIPEDIRAGVRGEITFDQQKGTLQVRGREGYLQSKGGLELKGVISVAFEIESIPFVTLDPVVLTATFIINKFFVTEPILQVDAEVPIPGFSLINRTWNDPQQFHSLLLDGKSVEVQGGIRDLASVGLDADDIVQVITAAAAASAGVPLPPIALNALGIIFDAGVGNAGISYDLGILSTATLTGKSVTLNGQQITSENQIISAPGLDLSKDSYRVNSSYEERFTYQLDYVVGSSVYLKFNPLGIPIYDYEKVPVEIRTPILPKQEVDLNFTSDSSFFTIAQEQGVEPPVAVGTIPPQTLQVGGVSRTVNVASYFSSQSNLTYAVSSNPRGIVSESISGSRVTITPSQAGSASVVVTAVDSNDSSLSAIQTIPVTVQSARAPTVQPPSDPTFTPPKTTNPAVEGLAEGVPVIVYDTGTIGLNIRKNPWVSNVNPDNRIGKLYDGSKGTITDGPQRNGGWTWWKIDWDLENKEGWSVEAFGGSQLLFPRPPDLEVRDFDVSDDEVRPGESFRVEATVRNNGPGESADTEIFFYYQKSDENTPRVAGSGKHKVSSLREGRSRKVWLRVEAPMAPGDYEYGAILPPDIPDTYDQELVDLLDPTKEIRLNNIGDERVEVTGSPDLIVESISANKSTVDPGESFRLEATVRNQGIGKPERNAILRYYRSSDANISDNDTEVDDDPVSKNNLDTNDTSDESVSLKAPNAPGVYYYGACVSVRDERNTDNNCSSGVAITVRELGPPDFVVSPPTLSANTLAPGESVTLTATVRNQGIGPASATTLRAYRSPNIDISDVDTEVGEVNIGSLRPGGTQTLHIRAEVPVAAGTYYYGVCVDPMADESNTVNNCSTGVALTVENLAPVAADRLLAQTLIAGTTSMADMSPYFSDPNEDILTYTASSETPTIVAVEMAGVSDSHLRLNPLAAGSATVTVEAADAAGLTFGQTFSVTVEPPANRVPVAIGTIPPQPLRVDGGLAVVDISGAFHDLDGDTLTYTARSSDTSVATASAADTQVTLTPIGVGTAIVTVTASDGTLTATQAITVTVESPDTDTNVCARTPQIRDAIVAAVAGVNDCADVTTAQLASIPLLDLTGKGIPSLKATDFRDLGHINSLRLESNQLTTLPSGIFSDLSHTVEIILENNQLTGLDADIFRGLNNLEWLLLANNRLSALDATIFHGLDNLHTLGLRKNQLSALDVNLFKGLNNLQHVTLGENELSALDANIFSGLNTLQALSLENNQLSSLDANLFNGLSNLQALLLNNNRLSALDANLFNGLNTLQRLYLNNNQLTALPAGIFSGLNALNFVWLWGNPGAPFTLTLELARTDNTNPEAAGPATVKVKLAEGAPFDMNIPLSVEDGTLLANTATLTSGQTESDPITVTQTGANFATVRLGTAPTVPQNYLGIQMAIGAPLVLFSDQDTPAEVWMPDANLRAAVRTTLGLGTGDALTQQALLGLTHLKYVAPDLTDTEKITDLTGLEHALNLEHLDLYAHLIRDLRPLENLANLKSLWLAGNKIADIRPLTNLPLERLDLGGNPITDFTPLADLTRLTRLDFWGNGLGDSDLIHITGLTLLTRLDLRSNKITNVTGLTQLVNLEKLSLKGNPISDLSPLRELLRQNPNVEIDIEIDTEAKSADLMIQGEPQVSQTTVAPGETFQIDTSVWNRGRGASSDTILRYYLSADETLSSEDMEVARHPVGPLHGRGANNNRRRAEVSDTLTAPETPGVHYYIVCIDEVAGEPDILNNCSQAIAITVEAPVPPSDPIPPENPQDPNDSDPVELEGPDLVISATRVDASTIKVFAGIRLHITLTNQGTETAAATMIRYYRSEDATISVEEDTELRAVPVGQLGAGQSYMTWAPLPGSTSVGVYYYGACLDGVATEVDTSNNCSDAIQITVIPPHEDTTTLRPNGTISQQALEVGDTPVVIDMSRYFVGTVETWTANSSKTDVVTASMSGSEVTLTAVKDGWATVTIEASHETLRAQQTFAVSVGGVAPGLVPVGTIPTHELKVGSSPVVLDVSAYFIGEVQTWTASTEQTHRLKVSMAGSSVTLTPVGNGWATVIIEASREDLRARQTFRVSVDAVDPADHNPFTPLIPSDPTDTPDVSPEVSIPDEQLRRDIRGTLGLEADDTITQQKMKRLTKIKVGGPPPEVISDLTGLEYAINLRELDVSYSQLSDITPLASLTALKTFRLTGSQLSDITPLANLTALTWLNLGYNSQLSDITPLANLTALTYLNLEKNQISDVTPLKNLTKLTYLNIFDNQISDISALTGLTKLMSLVLENNYQISDISALTGLTKLTQLSLHNNKISDVTPLQNLTALTRLTLHGNRIADINPLASLTSLTTILTLHQNQISDVTALGGLTSLTRLDLRWNQIKDVTSLEGLTSLTALSLANNPIEDLAPLRRLKEKNPNVSIDIDINVGAAPSAPHLPAETALLPNYPNPFNPETWIPYQLAEGADVTVTLYDVRGVMVRRLVVGHRHAGVYQSRGRAAHWDGRNALGEKVASGLYLYRFTAGDFTATGKLLIRK